MCVELVTLREKTAKQEQQIKELYDMARALTLNNVGGSTSSHDFLTDA